MRLIFLSAIFLLMACGFRAGDYEPVARTSGNPGLNWGVDLNECHGEVNSTGVSRGGYGEALDKCMAGRGYDIDFAASAAKFAAQEEERKKREREKAEKLKGY